MNEGIRPPMEVIKPINSNFFDFYKKTFRKFSREEKTKFLTHDFRTLMTPIVTGVDVALMGIDLTPERATQIKEETKYVREKLNGMFSLSKLKNYVKRIDKIIKLTTDIESKGDYLVDYYIKSIPATRQVIDCYIDVIKFFKHPDELLWSYIRKNSATVGEVLHEDSLEGHVQRIGGAPTQVGAQKNLLESDPNERVDGAHVVILKNIMSKFSKEFTVTKIIINADGTMLLEGKQKHDKRSPIFERYVSPSAKRVAIAKDDILTGEESDFSNGLFMAEMLAMACGQEMTMQYGEGDIVQLTIS